MLPGGQRQMKRPIAGHLLPLSAIRRDGVPAATAELSEMERHGSAVRAHLRRVSALAHKFGDVL